MKDLFNISSGALMLVIGVAFTEVPTKYGILAVVGLFQFSINLGYWLRERM